MRRLRWLDHLAPWMSWGALLSSGVFTSGELAVMALPLLLAALLEVLAVDLARFETWAHWGALGCLLPLLALGTGMVPGTAQLLFLLIGLRLALPRDLGRRRQILLMAFLLFLLATTASLDLLMGLWVLAWLTGAGAVLLQQAWEPSALLRRHAPPPPPFRILAPGVVAALLLGAGLFALLPRVTVGLRPPGWARLGWGTRAGLSDRLELGGSGPIRPDGEVVMRLEPLEGADPEAVGRTCALLRGLTLELYQDGTWHPWQEREGLGWQPAGGGLAVRAFLAPDALGLVPLPYGLGQPPRAEGLSLTPAPGGALRWTQPLQRVGSLRYRIRPDLTPAIPDVLSDQDRRLLSHPAGPVDLLRAWVRETVPADTPPEAMARRLTARLQSFRYTLDNPSGRAEDPLTDFLTRTQAGHCEYFASSLALLLRSQGIPARVVNGYRLGPWIEAGGYFAVSRSEAHAWVEWHDATRQAWFPLDPTPPAPPGPLAGPGLWATLVRGMDALNFRWDRYVVRYSDQDQVALVSWGQQRLQGLRLGSFSLPAGRRTELVAGASLLFLILLAWRLHRSGHLRLGRRPQGHLPQLAPLLRSTRRTTPPLPGETLRDWLARLGTRHPALAPALADLADRAEAVAYGGGPDQELARRARALAAELRRSTP